MPLPGDSQPGAEDSFVFGPGAPPDSEQPVPPDDLWASLMARWIAAVDPEENAPPPPPYDEIWGG